MMTTFDATVFRPNSTAKPIAVLPYTEETDFKDEIFEKAFNLYENEKFEGNLLPVKYMAKDGAFANINDDTNGYQTHNNRNLEILIDSQTRTSIENTVKERSKMKDFLISGLALIANRAMDCERMFSYPKTYLILGTTPALSKPNIRDYQRIIVVRSYLHAESNSYQNVVTVIILAPYSTKNETPNKMSIPCEIYHFHLFATDRYYTGSTPLTYKYYQITQALAGESLLSEIQTYFDNDSIENYILEAKQSLSFKLTDVLFSKDYKVAKLVNLEIEFGLGTIYQNSVNDLNFATLYIVDYYSRNRESPRHLWSSSQKSHDLLRYICNNLNKIKTVYTAAMYLGYLVHEVPVDDNQLDLWVMNLRLTKDKMKTISEMIVKQEREENEKKKQQLKKK